MSSQGPGDPRVREGQSDVELSRAEFSRRFRQRFHDPAFESVSPELAAVEDAAWKDYIDCHKNPRTGETP